MKLTLMCLVTFALLWTVPGCTWTETYRDYPPGIGTQDGHHQLDYPAMK
jgi:hypothetical protein